MDNIKQTLMQFEKQLQVLEKKVKTLEGRIFQERTISESKLPKTLSLREFITEKNPKDDVQKTLAIGYYLETKKGMVSFNADDIKKGFMTAKIKPPININDKINLNIRKGLLMETEEKKNNKKAWTLTNTGEKQIESI